MYETFRVNAHFPVQVSQLNDKVKPVHKQRCTNPPVYSFAPFSTLRYEIFNNEMNIILAECFIPSVSNHLSMNL